MRPFHALIAVVVPLLCTAFVFVAAETQRGVAPPVAEQRVRIAMPAGWVPFSADVRIVTPQHQQWGKRYRSANGSTAVYLYTPAGPAVTIHNTQTGLSYWQRGDSGWVSTPISEHALQPPRSVLWSNKLRRLPERVDSFEVYELESKDGVTRLMPALNGMVILWERAGGLRHEVFNIQIGEPPVDVFVPPPGVNVRRSEAALEAEEDRPFVPR